MTELLYQTDAYLKEFEARVTAVEGSAVALDRTAFYPTGGGQPHDTGTLAAGDHAWRVVEVRKAGDAVWHTLAGDAPPEVGAVVHGAIDWQRRYKLMRTHTALHALSGVVFRDFGAKVTGGNMTPGEARMDFELDGITVEFGKMVEDRLNAELVKGYPTEIIEMAREEALKDPDLIRTKVNLIPESVSEIRVVDIVGLDRQADGGTHVRSTAEVGRIRVVKTESKGKGNKRIRLEVVDA